MTIDELKNEIRALPDKEIGPLLEWLRRYYDEDLWDRQIAADIERLGEEEFVRRLSAGMNNEGMEREQAVLRILNALCPTPESMTEQVLNDIGLLLGAPLKVTLVKENDAPDSLKDLMEQQEQKTLNRKKTT